MYHMVTHDRSIGQCLGLTPLRVFTFVSLFVRIRSIRVRLTARQDTAYWFLGDLANLICVRRGSSEEAKEEKRQRKMKQDDDE